MILARLSRALREQNWFAVVLEFVIVIAGVVIGFQVTEWSKDRERRAHEDVALERLHQETVSNVEYFQRFVRNYEYLNTNRTEAIERLIENDFEGADLDGLRAGVISASFLPAATPEAGAYAEIVNSGMLSTIGDHDLRTTLADFHSELDFLQGQITYFRQVAAASRDPLEFDFITVIYDPESSRQRRHIIDFERAAEDAEFLEQVLVDNNSMRAISGWWMDTAQAAEVLCRETARLTGGECPATEAVGGRQ